MPRGYINPARNGGGFYLVFEMSVGYVKSDFELLNLTLWQDMFSIIFSFINVFISI